MNNKKTFTPSEDALIVDHSRRRTSIDLLATTLRTSRETVIRRAAELGVALNLDDDECVEPVETRALRCNDGMGDPLLERLKRVHGDRGKHRPT
jgi:hypothetical protein